MATDKGVCIRPVNLRRTDTTTGESGLVDRFVRNSRRVAGFDAHYVTAV
ncbi:hypothetical protein [Allosalinactinospora lopnorensis]